jgi:polysaccharide biosynthesis/export protein
MNKRHLVICCISCFTAFSCVPNRKIVYMQDLGSSEVLTQSGELVPYDVDEYRLQYNDVIDVSMKTNSAELNEILKIDDNQNQIRNMEGLNSGDAFFLSGYTVDSDGFVNMPLVGAIKVVGMNVKETKQAIEEKLEKFVLEDNYYVRVRLGGIRYSALGEFARPGKFTVLQNRLTIFEAIANAGDLTTSAKRTSIRLMRQYPEGVRMHTINLLSDKIMESEFFFIRPNDMIYAEPMKVKQLGTGVTLAQSLQLALSVITVALLYINVTN